MDRQFSSQVLPSRLRRLLTPELHASELREISMASDGLSRMLASDGLGFLGSSSIEAPWRTYFTSVLPQRSNLPTVTSTLSD